MASDLRLKQIFRLMGGLQQIAGHRRGLLTIGLYAERRKRRSRRPSVFILTRLTRSGSDTLESSQKAPPPSMGWTRGRGLCPTCGRCRTPRRRNYAPSRQASLASKNTKCSIEGSDPRSVKRFESPSPAPAGSYNTSLMIGANQPDPRVASSPTYSLILIFQLGKR